MRKDGGETEQAGFLIDFGRLDGGDLMPAKASADDVQPARQWGEARRSDGSPAADAYRPVTTPGVYIPTALTVAPQWPDLTPFAMTSPSQFRPKPPIALESEQWAQDYNEIKELGEKNSTKRSTRQTEDAR